MGPGLSRDLHFSKGGACTSQCQWLYLPHTAGGVGETLARSSSSVGGNKASCPHPTTWLGILKRHASVLPNSGPEERVEMERRGRLSLVDSEQNNRIKETDSDMQPPPAPGSQPICETQFTSHAFALRCNKDRFNTDLLQSLCCQLREMDLSDSS